MADVKIPKMLGSMSHTYQKAWYKKNKMELPAHLQRASSAGKVDTTRTKQAQQQSLKAYGATKGTRTGSAEGTGEELKDTVKPLTPEQHAKINAAKRASEGKPLTKDQRMSIIARSVRKAQSKHDVPTLDNNDAHDDVRHDHDLMHAVGVRHSYNEGFDPSPAAIAKMLVDKHGPNVTKDHIKELEDERDSHSGLDHEEIMKHVKKMTESVATAQKVMDRANIVAKTNPDPKKRFAASGLAHKAMLRTINPTGVNTGIVRGGGNKTYRMLTGKIPPYQLTPKTGYSEEVEQVNEMDSEGYRGHRGDEDPGKGPAKYVKPVTTKKTQDDAAKVLAKSFEKDKLKKEEVVIEGAKEDAEKLLGGPVKTRTGNEPKGKLPLGFRQARNLARQAMKAGKSVTESTTEVTEVNEMSHGKALAKMIMAKQSKHPVAQHMGEAKDPGEYDYEGDMAMSQLKSVIANAQKLHDMMEPDTNLPEWVQSKITLAEDYIVTAANYMSGELDEEVELDKAHMTDVQMKRREKYVKSMKSADWEKRYPGRGEKVMYATATKMAMKEEAEDLFEDHEDTYAKHMNAHINAANAGKWDKAEMHAQKAEAAAAKHFKATGKKIRDIGYTGDSPHIIGSGMNEEVEQIAEGPSHLQYSGYVNDKKYIVHIPSHKDLGDYSDSALHKKLSNENPHLEHHEVTAIVNSGGAEESHEKVSHEGKEYTHHVLNRQEPRHVYEEVEQVDEKYMGFKAVMAAAKKGGARNPAAVAAAIGRKKYGKEKFQAMAAAGKRHANEEVEQIDEQSPAEIKAKYYHDQFDKVKPVKAYDKEGKLVGHYRSMAHAKQMKPGHTYKMAEEVVTEAEGSVPTTPKEKELAAQHGDPNRITFGDVLKARLKSAAAKKMGK